MATTSLNNKFVTSFSEIYVSDAATTGAADASALETLISGDLVPLVAEIGSISNEANVIDVPEFGAAFKGKLRGQLDAGQLDSVLYWSPRDAAHLSLRNAAETGSVVWVTVKWIDTSTAVNSVEYVTFKGFVSSFGIDTSFDDVAKANATFVIDGALTFIDGTAA